MGIFQISSLGFLSRKTASNCEEHCNRTESAQVNFVDSTTRIEVIVLSDDDSESEADRPTYDQDFSGGKENQNVYVVLGISKHFSFYP